MKCPYCGHLEDKVIDSRPAEDGSAIRRRRECLSCSSRFTTYEKVELLPLLVIKKDGKVAEGISGKGTYTFAVNAKNYLIEDGIECELIVALFNENGEMEDIYSQKKDIPMTDANVSPSNIYVPVDVPDDSGYTAEVYLINNRQDIDLFRSPEKY